MKTRHQLTRKSLAMTPQIRILLCLLLASAVCLGACGDDAPPSAPGSPDGADDSLSELGDVSDIDDTNHTDDTADTDTNSGPDPAAEEIGQPCSDDLDCLSDFCVRLEPGADGFCSSRCFRDDECPDESATEAGIIFTCESLPITNAELEFACIGDDFCYDPDEDQYGFGPGCPLVGLDCGQSNPNINPGAPEKCDMIDHNCNGFFADAVIFPSDSRTCIVDENVGRCRAGQRVCNASIDEFGTELDVTVGCVANIEPGTSVERCNGVDDNCNGVADDLDDAIVGLGQACSTGATQCTDGKLKCDPEQGSLVCELAPGGPSAGEEPNVCDGTDNNCDGTVDENFKNEQGLYATLEHCGACNVNCVEQLPGTPEDLNVTAQCNIKNGIASCGFECDSGFINADGFSETGCEFSPDEGAIYVARPDDGGSDSGGCGSYESPCATIARGMARAQSSSKTRVRIGAGAYSEPIDVVNGVSLLGGHNARTWTRDTEIFVTSIDGALDVNRDTVSIFAENITNPTEISGLTIVATPADAGFNSVAVLVRNSNSNLTFTNNQIFAASGGAGTSGNSGATGAAGPGGNAGNASIYVDDAPNNHCGDVENPGGLGGSNTCEDLRNGGNDINVSGGQGGKTQKCAIQAPNRGNAPAGNGPQMGTGGQNATDARFLNQPAGAKVAILCERLDVERTETAGSAGGRGSDGAGGDGATDSSGSINTSWAGASGQSGQPGTAGSGGGGGGAAPNARYENDWDVLYNGASGGGGGSGGCPGHDGTPGTSGGASFAIFISGGSAPTITDNLLARGQGGNGGSGGNGAAGGNGGQGADGGARYVVPQYDFDCIRRGQAGGSGGRGGHGGAGGGGAGGISYTVAMHNLSGSQNYAGTNDFNLEGSVDTGGFGGSGGVSPSIDGSGNATGTGGDGVHGQYGRTISF